MKSMIVKLGDGTDIRLGLNTHQIASTTEARGLAVEVLRGSVWITFDGEYQDYVLNPGERLPINARGRVVLQGLVPSEVMFVRQPAIAPGIRAMCSRAQHPGDRRGNFVLSLSPEG